jgi:pimeloyl-ACP methyl ester carboxylesterase
MDSRGAGGQDAARAILREDGTTGMLYATLAAVLLAASAPSRPAAVEEGYVATPDGVRLYYRKVGRADDVLVVPGRLFVWAELEWLGEHYTLISYDMRNRGRSELVVDESRITFEQDVDDLEAVRRHFAIERMSLIGYSYLGKIVVLYALEHPRRVERIVQLGPVPPSFATTYQSRYVYGVDPVDPEVRGRLRELRSEKNYHLTHPREYCEEEWRVVHRPTLVGDPAKVDRVRIDVCDMPNEWPVLQVRHLRAHFEEAGMTHVLPPERVRALHVPVLTVHGTHDRNAPYGAGREWAYLLPEGRLLTVEGAAHHAFGEAREAVMPAILEFLQGAWPAAASDVTEDPRE